MQQTYLMNNDGGSQSRRTIQRKLDCQQVYTYDSRTITKAQALQNKGHKIEYVSRSQIVYTDSSGQSWWKELSLSTSSDYQLKNTALIETIVNLIPRIVRIQKSYLLENDKQCYISRFPNGSLEGKSFSWATPQRRIEWSKRGGTWIVASRHDYPVRLALDLLDH